MKLLGFKTLEVKSSGEKIRATVWKDADGVKVHDGKNWYSGEAFNPAPEAGKDGA